MKNILEEIMEILKWENRDLSIRELTEKLKMMGIEISPPTVLKYLKELKKRDKIREK